MEDTSDSELMAPGVPKPASQRRKLPAQPTYTEEQGVPSLALSSLSLFETTTVEKRQRSDMEGQYTPREQTVAPPYPTPSLAEQREQETRELLHKEDVKFKVISLSFGEGTIRLLSDLNKTMKLPMFRTLESQKDFMETVHEKLENEQRRQEAILKEREDRDHKTAASSGGAPTGTLTILPARPESSQVAILGQVETVQDVVLAQTQNQAAFARLTSYYAVGGETHSAPTGRVYSAFQDVHSQIAMRQRHHMCMMDAITQEFQRRMAAALLRDRVPTSMIALPDVQPTGQTAVAQGTVAIAEAVAHGDVRAGNSEADIWM